MTVFARAHPRPVQLGLPGLVAVVVEVRRARRRAPVSEVAPRDSLGRPQKPAEWRRLRAQVGGLERAMREVMAQRDEAREALRRYEEAKASSAWTKAADPELVAIKADLMHAADCGHPTCRRCERILFRLESERPRYADEREVVAELELGRVLTVACGRLLEAMSSTQAVGKRERIGAACGAMRAALGGDIEAARRWTRE